MLLLVLDELFLLGGPFGAVEAANKTKLSVHFDISCKVARCIDVCLRGMFLVGAPLVIESCCFRCFVVVDDSSSKACSWDHRSGCARFRLG